MSAAIRHAAKRICSGALPRTVEPTRLVNTKPPPQPQTQKQGLTADDKMDAALRMTLIEIKTEELYNHVAGFNARYTLGGTAGEQYITMLNQLSKHIRPRPNDPKWRSYRRLARFNDFVKQGAVIFIGSVTGNALYHWCYPEKKP